MSEVENRVREWVGRAASPSEIRAADCQQRWFLQYALGIEPEYTPAHLRLGTLWHRLMEVYWPAATEGDRYEALGTATARLAQLTDEAIAAAQTGMDASGRPSAGTVEEAEAHKVQCATMLDTYHARNFDRIAGLELLKNEEFLSAPTEAGDSSMGGTPDKIVRDRQTGLVWVVDHKTSKGIRADDARNGYQPQLLHYVWLAQRALGLPVAGFALDMVSTAKIATPASFKVNKDGSLSRVMPAGVSSAVFRQVIEDRGETLDKHPWYRERLGELEAAEAAGENPPVAWLSTRVGWEEVTRLDAEMVEIARGMAALRKRAETTYRGIHTPLAEGHPDSLNVLRQKAVALIGSQGTRFPRNGSQCLSRYGFRCALADVCEHRSADSLNGFRIGYDRKSLDNVKADA